MLTSKQLKIFGTFARNPFAEHTRGTLKKESKEKSNNLLNKTVNLLKEEKIIDERIIGKSGILTLNIKNELTQSYIVLSNQNIIEEKVRTAIQKIQEELRHITSFYALVVFGSYATNKQKNDSDLDIAIFIEDNKKRKIIEASINTAKLKTVMKIDAHVIPKQEMIEMLTNNEENLGKQIARKHLVMENSAIFYDILLEGMKHGFRI